MPDFSAVKCSIQLARAPIAPPLLNLSPIKV